MIKTHHEVSNKHNLWFNFFKMIACLIFSRTFLLHVAYLNSFDVFCRDKIIFYDESKSGGDDDLTLFCSFAAFTVDKHCVVN